MTDVVIGDDHAVFLDALSSVLADLGCTVTKASTVADTIREVGAHQPDVCLIDGHFAADDDGISALGPADRCLPASEGADPLR